MQIMSAYIDLGSGLRYEVPLVPEPPKPEFFNVQERADLAVATYSSLNLVGDKGKTTYEFTKQMQSLHDALVADHPDGGLEVVSFRPVNLEGPFTLRALFLAYNGGDEQLTENSAFWELLDQYSVDEFNARTIEDAEVGTKPFTLGNQALGLVLGGNTYNDERLHFARQNVTEQIASVQSSKLAYDQAHIHTAEVLTTPADEIILAAQERELGNPLPHGSSWSRHLQMPEKTARGSVFRPSVYSSRGGLRVSGFVPDAVGSVGVGRSVGQKPESLAS